MSEVRLQALVGREVHDIDGKRVGRIGEVCAQRIGADCHVTEYRLGPAAFLGRLGIAAGSLVGWRRKPMRVPWQQLDISDPHHPRLRCRFDDLQR